MRLLAGATFSMVWRNCCIAAESPTSEVGSVDSCLSSLTSRLRRRFSRARFADRKSTRLNSSHEWISYAVFCLKKKKSALDMSLASKRSTTVCKTKHRYEGGGVISEPAVADRERRAGRTERGSCAAVRTTK